MLTRPGEAGVDALTIMRIAGHALCPPSPELLERAFEKLQSLNRKVPRKRVGIETGIAARYGRKATTRKILG
jgi:hypothetical protein